MMLVASLFVPSSLEKIAGYAPGSQATDHNAIDLDQAAMESFLSADDFIGATSVYTKGGNSKSYTTLNFSGGLGVALKKGDKLQSSSGAVGKAYDSYAADAKSIKFQYSTLDTQFADKTDPDDATKLVTDFATPAYQSTPCRVGGLGTTVTSGCIGASDTITVKSGDSTNAVLTPSEPVALTDHKNGRTLQGFSTGAEGKMYAAKDSTMSDGKKSSCKGCPYTDFLKFYDYYGSITYADDWVTAALAGTDTSFTSGRGAKFSEAVPTWDGAAKLDAAKGTDQHNATRVQAVKKGTAYLNVWMYVIREFEDAIDDCESSCIACNDDPVHAWDEGVAFWTGSLEGKDGQNGGKLIYALAEKRCANFRTCGPNGDSTSATDTTAKVNYDLFYHFANAQYLLVNGRCEEVKPIVRKVVGLMTVPLIQGTLRYAYKMYVNDLSTEANGYANVQSEAATFAASVLPMVHACSATDAETINAATQLGTYGADANRPDYSTFTAVKVAFENNYECLGVTCEDIGGMYGDLTVQNQAADGRRLSEGTTTGKGYFRAFSPCTTASMSGGDYADIVGYAPGSQVTDHNAIDLDQAAMESYIGGKEESDLALGQLVYENGGNSKSYLEMTVTGGTPLPIKKGSDMYATDMNGHPVRGKAYDNYDARVTTIRFQYKTSDDQANYVPCRAGSSGYADADQAKGCVDSSKDILVTYDNGDGTTTLLATATDSTAHKNGRTLKGFSTNAKKKMYTKDVVDGCKGCPYEDYLKFYDYYGSHTYAHDYVTAAFDGTKVSYSGPASDADFSATGDQCPGTAGSLEGKPCEMMDIRVQAIKKGTAYMNVWMYVIREFEDAIDDCENGCIACNDDPVHAWDEGVAFYAGSLAGTSPNDAGGKLIWALAEKRCANYKTCGPNGDLDSVGPDDKAINTLVTTAKVNNDLLFEFNKGRDALQAGKCAEVRPITRKVVSLMTIPLIQGTMRYARYIAVGDIDGDALGEAAVFAASVLPMVHACSPADAKIIDDHTKLGQTNMPKSTFEADHQLKRFTDVKEAFERNYACLGVTCADVGGLFGSVGSSGPLGKGYYPGATPCKDSDYYPPPSPPPPMSPAAEATLAEIAADLPTGALVGIIVAAVVAVFAVVCVLIMVCKERSGSPIFTPLDVKPSV